ncbi:hypothetical protein, partial [Staphylococcus capitis]|uniref:hypothetical protein n=1 Tax=Staphylococcus capitis TaxID=29388 RepID=UPI001642F904
NIGKEAGLERGFQAVEVDEARVEDRIEMLKGLGDGYEVDDRINICDEGLEGGGKLSNGYV